MNKLYENNFVGAITPDVYTTKDTTATPVVIKIPASPVSITGRALACKLSGKTAAQKAALAAEHMANGFTVTNLSIGQVALLFGVSRSSLNSARGLPTEARALVATGQRPMATPQDKVKQVVRSDFDLVRVFTTVGPDRAYRVFDWLTMPTAEAAE